MTHQAPFHDKESAIAFMENIMQLAKDTFATREVLVTPLDQPGPINVVQVGAVGDFRTSL